MVAGLLVIGCWVVIQWLLGCYSVVARLLATAMQNHKFGQSQEGASTPMREGQILFYLFIFWMIGAWDEGAVCVFPSVDDYLQVHSEIIRWCICCSRILRKDIFLFFAASIVYV